MPKKSRSKALWGSFKSTTLLVVLLFASALFMIFGATGFVVAQNIKADTKEIDKSSATKSELLKDSIKYIEEADTPHWQGRLYAPTYIVKIVDKWFIVDCWQNRVIWSNDINLPIKDWQVMDDNLAGPHSIAYGNGFYIVEDTGRNKINTYKFDDNEFIKVNSIRLGNRPHRVAYEGESKSFYVLSSVSQEMHRIAADSKEPELVSTNKLDFLNDKYTRSFTILGDKMLFVSGDNQVVEVTFKDDVYQVTDAYTVPKEFENMNDIYFTGTHYVITATPRAIGTVEQLNQIPGIVNISRELQFKGTPYYVSRFNESTLLVPEIGDTNAITQLKQDEAVGVVFDGKFHEFESVLQDSIMQIKKLPK